MKECRNDKKWDRHNWLVAYGKRVRDLRIERGMTIKELSRVIGISSSTIAKWEKFLAKPQLISLTKIAKFFNKRFEYLIGRED